MKLHVKKGDTVIVLSGNNKGKTAKVLSVSPKIAEYFLGDTLNTFAVLPLLFPDKTITVSPFLTCNFISFYYKTSGANETIFINFFSLSSLATGPNTLVPFNSSFSFNKIAALSSNLI
jgi:hypothetical protein